MKANRKPEELVRRFSGWAVFQHAAIILLFVALLVTGLPQKWPQAELSRWLVDAMGGIFAARWIHRVAGLLFTVLTAVYEVFYSALYWGGYRVPASIVAAVVVNLALIWFTVAVTGRRLAVVPVAVLWVAVMVVASSRRSEGDLLLTDNNWVGIVMMLVGSLTYAVAGYRLVLAAFRPHP